MACLFPQVWRFNGGNNEGKTLQKSPKCQGSNIWFISFSTFWNIDGRSNPTHSDIIRHFVIRSDARAFICVIHAACTSVTNTWVKCRVCVRWNFYCFLQSLQSEVRHLRWKVKSLGFLVPYKVDVAFLLLLVVVVNDDTSQSKACSLRDVATVNVPDLAKPLKASTHAEV